MAFDAHANLAVSLVATAPSPATSGTSLVVTAGEGSRFPATPFNAVVCPANTLPDPTNAEIVRVTAISTDTFTMTRAQESTTARSIVVGDLILAAITAKTLTDVEGTTLHGWSANTNDGDIDLNSHKLVNVTDPTTAQDAATKAYVDANAGSSPLTTKGDLYGYNTADARIPVGTDGDVLTADSSQTLGLKWAAASGGASLPLIPSGLWLPIYGDGNNAYAPSQGYEWIVGFLVGAQTIDSLAVRNWSAGDTGSVFRLGIRADSSGVPGAPQVEGTVPADVGGGSWQTLSVSYSHPGGILWISVTAQNWVTTAPQLRSGHFGPWPVVSAFALSTPQDSAYSYPIACYQSGVTGSLPSTFAPANSNAALTDSNAFPMLQAKGA